MIELKMIFNLYRRLGMAQITCKNVTLGYDNHAIIEDLNFSVCAGDYLCIVG